MKIVTLSNFPKSSSGVFSWPTKIWAISMHVIATFPETEGEKNSGKLKLRTDLEVCHKLNS